MKISQNDSLQSGSYFLLANVFMCISRQRCEHLVLSVSSFCLRSKHNYAVLDFQEANHDLEQQVYTIRMHNAQAAM